MNFFMKRAVLRASYNSPLRARLDAYNSELRARRRDKKAVQGLPTDPFALKQITLLDPVRAINEIGFPLFDFIKELSTELGSNSLQQRTWFVKNVPEFRTFLLGKTRITDVISDLRKEKHLPDPYILEYLTVSLAARQPILDISKEVFDGYNHIILPLPNIWKIHPIRELAKYLIQFDVQVASANPKAFKLPLLLLRSMLATIDVISYLNFEKVCMDAYLEEKRIAEKEAKAAKKISPLDSKPALKDTPPKPITEDSKVTAPKLTSSSGSSGSFGGARLTAAGALVDQDKNGPLKSDANVTPAPITIPGLEPAEEKKEVALGRNLNSKGEPASYILYFFYRIVDLLEKSPQRMEILLESDELVLIFMERTKPIDRSAITGKDIGTRMYYKVLEVLESELLTYKIIPPPPPPTPEELYKRKLQKQLDEEEKRRASEKKSDAASMVSLQVILAGTIAALALL